MEDSCRVPLQKPYVHHGGSVHPGARCNMQLQASVRFNVVLDDELHVARTLRADSKVTARHSVADNAEIDQLAGGVARPEIHQDRSAPGRDGVDQVRAEAMGRQQTGAKEWIDALEENRSSSAPRQHLLEPIV